MLDNSKNKNKINKEKLKKGDKDGRQEQDKQQSTDKEERRKRIREAIARIREIGGGVDGGGHDGNVSVFDKRRGGKGLGDGLVDYHIETPDKIKSIFEGAGVSTPSYNKLKLNNQQSIDTFKKAIAKAKKSLKDNGASVELKDDYTDINLYLSQDGESGFGIKPNGDIVSVFSSKKVKGRSAHMLEMAISQGGRQLDCFDIYLTKIYETHGFKPVAKMKWDDEYIPEGWNKDNFKDYNNGEPALTAGRRHVVFMVYDPNNDKKDNEIPYITDYDDGDKIQQKYFEEREREREKAKNKKENKITKNNKITITNKSKDGLDKAEDKINNFLKGNANKLKEEVKKETQADAKKKEFREQDVNRDADGKFATQNAGRRQKNSSSNKSKDNDKKGTDDNGGIENSKKYINKCIKSLPKHLQPIGKRLYSGELGGGELVYKSKYTPIGGNFLDQDKLDNLSDTEYSIFAFTEDGRQNSGWEERDNSDIIELIQKSPLKREALFRGEPENNIGELKVGKIINFGNKIRSFTNTEDGKSIAKGFAFKYNTKEEGAARPIVYQINKPVHALCINPLSYYQSQEDEYLCYGEFKIIKVLKKKNFDFIIIEPLE